MGYGICQIILLEVTNCMSFLYFCSVSQSVKLNEESLINMIIKRKIKNVKGVKFLYMFNRRSKPIKLYLVVVVEYFVV